MLDYRIIVAELTRLNQAASAIEGWTGDHSKTLIRLNEYGLALDEIAYAYLNSGQAMPAELFQIFEKFAVASNMESDPELEGVERLRAAGLTKPARLSGVC